MTENHQKSIVDLGWILGLGGWILSLGGWILGGSWRLGDKARPSDPDWMSETHNRAVTIFRWLKKAPETMPKLFGQFPKNPVSKLYEQAYYTHEKIQIVKNLFELHNGEIREAYGWWQKSDGPVPKSWSWYNSQYARGDRRDVNFFLSYGANDSEDEHWERRSWGFSLMRLFELYGERFSAEAIYEFYITLPIMVKNLGSGWVDLEWILGLGGWILNGSWVWVGGS